MLEDPKPRSEPLYKVIIHNDNVTPMDFVVHILKTIFYLGVDRASEIMMTAHINGNAYVQTLAQSERKETN
ncbi:MAG: ATP-dependent Clp protease adaptor ClpS [Anaerolineales bacterium]